MADAFEQIAAGNIDERQRLARWADEIRGRGACRHPDGATRFMASALQVFTEEIDQHLRYGRCAAADREILPTPQRPGGHR
jgi:NADH:ubiquinone oxidoreductase subunit F (NADH-binding)